MGADQVIQGRLPIVISTAQQITSDPISIQLLIWVPSAASHSFALYDNQDNVVAQGAIGASAPLVPVVIPFVCPIPCQGLSLKTISSGDTLLVYPAAL
jgi:hypothetical protein